MPPRHPLRIPLPTPTPNCRLSCARPETTAPRSSRIWKLTSSKYPDSPRRGAIYRALLESEMNLHNQKSALEYAEKVIAIQPEDSQSMYLAVTLLEKMPDEASQLRAIDYDTRLIDRVSKADPESRPQQMTLEDWQAGRNKFLVDLYVLRGRVQHHLHKNDDAVKDLTAGFRLLPNAEAALTLGEIAEENKHADEAIRQYATAFILASQEPAGRERASAGPRFAALADGQSLAIHARFERGPWRHRVIGLRSQPRNGQSG